MENRTPPGRFPAAAAALCGLAVFAALSILAVLKYSANNFSLDVGSILQAFHRSLDGSWMSTTLDGGERNYSRWAGHTEFVFALLFPAFAAFPSAATLLIAQAAAIAAGGWAVFALARERWGDGRHALLCALAYWSFPFLFHLQLSGLHADPFFIAPYLMAWHAHRRGGRARFWAWVALGTAVKEYACVFNFLLGALIAAEGGRKRAAGLFALAAGQFLVLTPLVNWLFRDAAPRLNLETHLLPVGDGASALWSAFAANLAHPGFLPKTLALAALFAWPLLRYPKGLILAAPLYLALTFLTTDTLLIDHHFSLLLPALFIPLAEAGAGMEPRRRGRYLAFGLLSPSLILLLSHPASPISAHIREVFLRPQYRNLFHYRITPHDRLADSLLASFPKGLAVAAEHDLRPKLADREWAFMHPHPNDSLRADRYVFDFFETTALIPHEVRRARCAALLRSGDFHPAAFADGLLVLAKGPPPAGSLSADLFRWETVTDDTLPSGRAGIPLGGIPVEVRASLSRAADGYVLQAEYRGSFGPAEALVSVFSRPSGDSLRVLHLPGYVLARLPGLPAGRYRETLAFRGPGDLPDGGWSWELRFHRGHPYLPLAGRADLILEKRFLGPVRIP